MKQQITQRKTRQESQKQTRETLLEAARLLSPILAMKLRRLGEFARLQAFRKVHFIPILTIKKSFFLDFSNAIRALKPGHAKNLLKMPAIISKKH